MKLNVILAKTDHLAGPWKHNLEDYIKFFKVHQGAFKGERRTYVPSEGTIDEPTLRGNVQIVTTVAEKLKWLVEVQTPYINSLFAQEATNASNTARADLIVNGVNLGNYSSLELLRLKSLLEDPNFRGVYENIPVRPENEIWAASDDEQYRGRGIFQTDKISGTKKSTMVEEYILPDPVVGAERRTPMVSKKNTTIELGQYTHQRFSGEYSHRQRAEILMRINLLRTAVLEALKVANEAEVTTSEMTAEKLFGYIHDA